MKKEIVFLHGWGRSKADWQRVIEMFGDEVTCSAVDFPGFGDSKNFNSSWSIPEYSNWLENIVKDKESLILVGHSFGGRVASFLASKNPSNLTGLVLFAAPSIYRPSMGIVFKSSLASTLKKILPRAILNKLNRFKSEELRDSVSTGKGDIFKRAVTFDQTEYLKKIKVPTLIIWGDNDKQTSYIIGKEMQGLIKGSEIKVVEGAGHDLHFTNPNLFYGILKKYVESI